jgi:OOP family OmpA-OmpF porin
VIEPKAASVNSQNSAASSNAPQVEQAPAAKQAPSQADAPGLQPAPASASSSAPSPAAAPAAAVSSKVTYAADAFFDFNKSVIKPEAKAKLDDLVDKIKAVNLEVIIAVGHTDAVGSDAYNQKLSMRRSNAVKAYLINKGVDKTRIYTEGKGEKQPVADNGTKEGRSKNRRVEIEVVGARKN